jgi:hypothetical protein
MVILGRFWWEARCITKNEPLRTAVGAADGDLHRPHLNAQTRAADQPSKRYINQLPPNKHSCLSLPQSRLDYNTQGIA